MAYKKYIKRGGKLYGPYVYESRREGDRVISVYKGTAESEENKRKKNFVPAIAIFSVILLAMLFVFINLPHPTGKIALQVSPSYQQGEFVSGMLKLSLKQGEIIPSSTIISTDLNGEERQFLLSDLIAEQTTEGSFYIENAQISGSGYGYGIAGIKTTYPDIEFKLKISKEQREKAQEEPKEKKPEAPVETPAQQPAETPANPIEQPQITQETPAEPSTEQPLGTTPEPPAEEKQQEETPSEESALEITGAVVEGKEEKMIDAVVSANSPFNYALEEGETAEIAQGSVRLAGAKDKKIDESALNLQIQASQLTITTSYSETETGFGADFTGNEVKIIEIPLEKLNITAQEGTLQVALQYNDAEIISAIADVNIGYKAPEMPQEELEEIPVEQPAENISEIPTIPEENLTNATAPEINITIPKNITELNITGQNITNVTELNVTELNITELNLTELNITQLNLSLIRSIPDITISKNGNMMLNLSEFFANAKNYTAFQPENISIGIENDIATIIPEVNFTGTRNASITAYQGDESIEEQFVINVQETNITIQTIQYQAVIGKPVKWKKIIMTENPENITLKLPASSDNITIKEVKEVQTTETTSLTGQVISGRISANIELNKNKELGFIKFFKRLFRITGKVAETNETTEQTFEQEVNVPLQLQDNTQYEVEYYTDAPYANETETSNYSKDIIVSSNIHYENVLSYASLPIEVSSEKAIKLYWYTTKAEATKYGYLKESNQTIQNSHNNQGIITGDIAKISEKENEAENKASRVRPVYQDSNLTNSNFINVSFYNEGVESGRVASRVRHQPDELGLPRHPGSSPGSAAYIPLTGQIISELGNQTNEEIIKVEINFDAYDTNNNTLIDYIEWLVPSLSNQTYELSITILNVHSHPSLYGNWSVEFETTGTANLTITATQDLNYTNETTRWHNESENETLYDLKFLEVRCGNETKQYEWQGENCFMQECSVLIADYSCNITAQEISKVLTPKLHVLRFNFGGQEAYAYNAVGNESSESDNNEWRMFHRFLNHTGYINSSAFATRANANFTTYLNNVRIVWSSPAVANGYVYVGSLDNDIYQLNASDVSQKIANYTTSIDVYSSPAVADGYVYVGSWDATGYIYQLNASNISQLIASYLTGRIAYSSPAVAKGYVYIGSRDDKVYQLNATNVSKLIATYTTGGDVDSSPAVADGYVYVGSYDGNVYQLNASNISQKIANVSVNASISSPAVANGYVYVGSSTDNKTYQLNASNISIIVASYTTNGSVVSSPAVANGYVYIGSYDDKLYQLNASNISQLIATYTTGGDIRSSPIATDNYVFVGSYDKRVYQLNASNVSLLIASYTTGDEIDSTPAFVNGYLYVGSDKLYQFSSLDVIWPSIAFVSPTPANATTTANTSIEVNISITNASDLAEMKWNWNSTNYTFYNDSLVLMFNFNNVSAIGENSTFAVDVSKYGNNGTLINGTAWNCTSAKYGCALQFDGVNDYVKVSDSASLNITGNMTIEAWFYPTKVTSDVSMIISKATGDTANSIYWALYFYNISTSTYITYDERIPPDYGALDKINASNFDKWNHVVVVINGTWRYLYLNGVVVNSTNFGWNMFAINGPIEIGDIYNATVSTNMFNGSIDEVRLYNRSLSAAEITQHYYSNLYKYANDSWAFYSNQSNLTTATYNYSGCAKDISGNENCTETRILNITAVPDTIFPGINFTFPTPPNGTTTTNTSVQINISITNASDLAEMKWNWNGTNYTFYNDSLVLMLNFDNVSAIGENSTFAVDVSKYGNNGTISGAVWNASGKYGKALSFDGSNDYVNVGNDTILDPKNSSFSIEFWFRTSSNASTHKPISKYSTTTNQGFQVSITSVAYLEIYSGGNGNISAAIVPNLNDGTWRHYAGVRDRENLKITVYIDGAEQASITDSLGTITNTQSLAIGMRAPGDNNGPFNGSIDEVRLYNRSLSAAEITQHYYSNLYKYANDSWAFYSNQTISEPTGSYAYNYSGCAKDTSGNENCTETRLLTIQGIAPIVTINLPLAQNYSTSNVSFNATLNENGSCIYSLNAGLANYTMQNNGNRDFNATNSSIADGQYTARFYCNDTAGNWNRTETRAFGIDTIKPSINLTYPQNTSYGYNVTQLNYTISDANLQTCWWSSNNGVNNVTITCGTNITGANSSEGNNTWLVSVNDSAGNVNFSRVTFVKDTINPNVSTVHSPVNNGNYSNTTIMLNVSVSDATIGLSAVYFNLSNSTGWSAFIQAFQSGGQWNTTLNSSLYYNGRYNLSVFANDSLNNLNSSESIVINIDKTTPLISYGSLTEADGTNATRTWIYVNVTFTEANLANITFLLRNNSAVVNSTTFTTAIYTINWTNLPYTNYTYNATIYDAAGNLNSTATRRIKLNNAPVLLSNISTRSWNQDTSITINLTAHLNDSDADTLTFGNNAVANIDIGINQTTGIATLTPDSGFVGARYVVFNATDGISTANSNNITLSVNQAGGGGGGGGVDGGGTVPCTPSWNCGAWSNCTQGQQTRSCTDANSCGTTNNKPAETQTCEIKEPVIEYYSPELQVNTRNNSDVAFTIKAKDISGISEITLNAKWLVDSVLAKEDNGGVSIESSLLYNFNKNRVVKAVVSSSYNKTAELIWNVIVLNTACNEEWQCFWSSCNSNGYSHAQNCTDLNNCGTNAEKPISTKCYIDPITREMSPFAGGTVCMPKWICAEWSACDVIYSMNDIIKSQTLTEGMQERTCDDINRCQPSRLEYQPCTFNIPISMRTVELCNENYVEIYDLEKNMLVSRLKESEFQGTARLDIRLATVNLTGYCDYCYDKIKNYDEEAVDCGGANCPICKEIPFGIDYRDIVARWAKFILWSLLPVLIAIFISSLAKLRKRRIYEAERHKHAEPKRIRLRRHQKPQGIIKERFFR